MEKTKNFSEKFWSVVDKALIGWSIFLMGMLAILVILSVIMRYVFNTTYVWSEELIVYLFISTTYFGSVICVKEMEHIDIPFIWELAPNGVKRLMEILVALVNIIIQISLTFFSFTWIEKTGSSFTTGLYIPFYTVYIMFPICFMLMAIYTFRRIDKSIIPRIKSAVKSQPIWRFLNALFFGIYIAALCGLAYTYFHFNGIQRIAMSLKPTMMTIIYIVFSAMFALCFVLVFTYAIERLICIIKKNTLGEIGGEQ